MAKKIFSKKIFHFIAIALSFFAIPFCILFYGTSSENDINSSMAFAFDNYLKTTGQTYVAARFCSDDPRDPIRRNELKDVTIYQNLWQLSKGPDNSLIRVMEPATLGNSSDVVYPFTLYPKIDSNDDTGAISPTVYTGYDQDFRGDYLDIKIKKLDDKSKQISWSDFYAGGKLENYKTDTHSILISENVARKIISERYDKQVYDVTDQEIQSLVGTTIRCKQMKETGTQESPERELSKPLNERDSDIINSSYFDSSFCRVKKIIGILDNESAKKYYPIIGDFFSFSVPNMYVSYDYFHPIAYGMFKNNLVGNKTSLKYFMSFSDFAQEHNEYHLNFCDIENNKLILNGTLQENYINCLSYNKSNTRLIFSIISIVLGILLTAFALLYLTILRSMNEDLFKKYNLSIFITLLLSVILSIFICSLIKSILLFGFRMPIFSTRGFSILLIIFLVAIICFMLLSRKYTKKIINSSNVDCIENNYRKENNSKHRKTIRIIETIVLGALLAISSYILVNIILTKNSITSIGIPLISLLLGVFLSTIFKKMNVIQNRNRINRALLKSEVYDDLIGMCGVLIGLGLSFVLTSLNFIWITGIDSSIKVLLISFVIGLFAYIICFWISYLITKTKKSLCVSYLDKDNKQHESIDI